MNQRLPRAAYEPPICEVCGRSLLSGESASVFIAGGARRTVCELCSTRAVHDGWIREGTEAISLPPARRRERARSLVGRMRARFEEGPPLVADPTLAAGDAEVLSAPAPRLRGSRRVHAVPASPERRLERALELFNASEHTRTVAGVGRSLGAPSVSVHPLRQGRAVEVLVAWELCWYRYEVDLLEEDRDAVSLRAQGDELAEVLGEPLPPNAVADEHGELSLSADIGITVPGA